MADNVTFTAAADATPPGGTKAATDELSDGSHAGIAKLAVSADGDRTLVPATAADGLLVEVSNPTGTGLTDAELRATPVAVSGTISTGAGPTVATRSAVADSASDTLILAANAARKNFSVTNDSTAVLYLAPGTAAASLTDYSVQIPTAGFYSDDQGYTGEVRGIWATDPGTGAARITEYT